MSYRKNYFHDYEMVKVPANNKKGYKVQYDYVGDWCVWNEGPAEFDKRKRIYVAVSCVSLLLLILCGIQPVPLNRNGFVAIPGLVALAALMYAVIGAVQIFRAGLHVQERDQRGMRSRFSVGHAVSAVSLLVCTVAGIVVLLIDRTKGSWLGSAFVIIGYFAAAACSCLLSRYHKTLSYYIVPGKNQKRKRSPPRS